MGIKIKPFKDQYLARHTTYLRDMAKKLEEDVKENISGCKHIDFVYGRPKSVGSFIKKATKEEDGKLKYNDPINQVQDQLGVRIVVYYLEDVRKISKIIEKYYRLIENRHIVPDSEKEFGYEGKHYVLFIPAAVLPNLSGGNFPKFFELQIKTLFQHAWSQAEHDLRYKSVKPLKKEDRRKVFYASAQAWGADMLFQELASKSVKNNKKIKKAK